MENSKIQNFSFYTKEFKVAYWSEIKTYLFERGIRLTSHLLTIPSEGLGIKHVSELSAYGDKWNHAECSQIAFVLKDQTDFIDFTK